MRLRRFLDAHAMEQHQAQPQGGQPLFNGLRGWSLVFAISTVLAFSCNFARLVLAGKLFSHQRIGVPGLCYGAIAYLDYKVLDNPAVFMLSSVSQAIAVTNYNQTEGITTQSTNMGMACRMDDYFPGDPKINPSMIYAYLIAISVLDLVGMVPIQGICWYRLSMRGYGNVSFLCYLICGVLSPGFEIGSIYLASRAGNSAIIGISVIIFLCGLISLSLSASIYAAIFREDVEAPGANPRDDLPNMVGIYNPNNDRASMASR